MSRRAPWEGDPRFDHPDTSWDKYVTGAGEAMLIRYPDGERVEWRRLRGPSVPDSDWYMISKVTPRPDLAGLEFTADDWFEITGHGWVAVFKAGNHGLRKPTDLVGMPVKIDGIVCKVRGVERHAISLDDWRDQPIGLLVESMIA